MSEQCATNEGNPSTTNNSSQHHDKKPELKENSSDLVESSTTSGSENEKNIVDVKLQIDELIKCKRKESFKSLTPSDELELIIEFCKNQLCQYEQNIENDERRKFLMEKLVDCRLQLQSLKESEGDENRNGYILVKGHKFVLQSVSGRNPYCEVCVTTIWRILQRWMKCRFCGFRTHEKCIPSIIRQCPSVKANNPKFRIRTEICEERGLDEQNYKCAECGHAIHFGASSTEEEPRLCDYNGRYYCRKCHWNDEWVIPARIVHNWDCEKYLVCRASKQLLSFIDRKPLLNITQLNPSLMKFVTQLNRLHTMRRNILFMKCYFMCCKEARKLRILQYLNRRQHFVDSAEWYSIADLRDLCENNLLSEIEQIMRIFDEHITSDCLICRGNGFFCELCTDKKKEIFPFSEGVSICHDCCAVFHKICFDKVSHRCPRCARRKQRIPVIESPIENSC